MTMDPATTVERELKHLSDDLIKAFAGGPGPSTKGFGGNDSAKMAAAFISAYHSAALINPGKAARPKGAPAPLRLSDPTAIAGKGFWDDAWDFIREVAPVVVNALTKDFEPQRRNLKDIVAALPEHRRNDKAWTEYATNALLYGCWQTTNCFGTPSLDGLGAGIFNQPPTPPAGADKGWFDDVCSFVVDAAPVVLPIVMSLL